MSAHTPGPWTIGEIVPQSVAKVLQPMFQAPIHYGDGNCLAIVYLGGEGATRCDAKSVEANARLIAASPKMFAALKKVVAWLNSPEEGAFSDGDLAECEQAVAEAEGKQ